MTTETLSTAGDDDFDIDDDDISPAYEADPRAAIEAFTGSTMEHLTRVAYSVAYRELPKKQDRQDAVQEAFLRLSALACRQSHPAQHPVTQYPAAYFARIVTNVIIDGWKKELAAKRGGGAPVLGLNNEMPVEDPRPTPPHAAAMSELRRRILTAVETLPAAHRQVAELALDIDSGDFNRHSHAEIAERLNLRPTTVKSRINEIKEKLAICLADWKEEQK